jgi:uncharacterized protein YdhG (YjbR/CyaY superfamily)
MTKTLVDRHLKKFTAHQRAVLMDLRKMIANELPAAQEVIKYGIPTFLIHGVPVIGYDGYKKHNSIFPYSGSLSLRLKKELSSYDQTKGSIHFQIDEKFPKSLLKKIIKAKIEQINLSYPKKSGEYLEFYGNGVLKASGKMKNNLLTGKWAWYRKNGVIMRSGQFKMGKQIGEWTTYDSQGKLYKVTYFN